MLTHFLATLTQFLARIRRENSFRGANFGIFCEQLFQAGLRVNFEFGQEYASEKNGTIILIKLSELAILCVRSGEFMVFTTPMQVYDLLIAILSLGSPSGNRLLDVPSWRRTPLGNRKRCLHRLSRLTCLLILCLLQFGQHTCEQELDRLCQILPDMIPICDLNRLWSAFFGCSSIVFATIATDMEFRDAFSSKPLQCPCDGQARGQGSDAVADPPVLCQRFSHGGTRSRLLPDAPPCLSSW